VLFKGICSMLIYFFQARVAILAQLFQKAFRRWKEKHAYSW
jgi:hypothetical protein